MLALVRMYSGCLGGDQGFEPGGGEVDGMLVATLQSFVSWICVHEGAWNLDLYSHW